MMIMVVMMMNKGAVMMIIAPNQQGWKRQEKQHAHRPCCPASPPTPHTTRRQNIQRCVTVTHACCPAMRPLLSACRLGAHNKLGARPPGLPQGPYVL